MAAASPARAARRSGVVPAPSIVSSPRSSLVRYGCCFFSCAFDWRRDRAARDQIHAGQLVVDDLRRRPVRRRHRVHVHGGIQRRPARLVGEIRVGALVEQHARDVVVAVDDRAMSSGVMPSGSAAFMSAPRDARTVHALDAALARGKLSRRQSAGRQPLLARLERGLALPFLHTSIAHSHRRRARSAPASSPDDLRPPPTSAPSVRATLRAHRRRRRAPAAPCAASTLPVRAAVISAVSPSVTAAFASAPAFSSFSIIAASPLTQAR